MKISIMILNRLKSEIDAGRGVRELAALTGIDASTITRLVSGERRLTMSHADRLACHFKLGVRS